jgi:hypothetical protein
MDDFYREIILEHYKNPSNRGEIPNATLSHEEDNPLCGDRIHIDLLVKDGIVEDAELGDLSPCLGRQNGPGHEAAIPIAAHAHHAFRHALVLHQAHGDLDRMLGGRDHGGGGALAAGGLLRVCGH